VLLASRSAIYRLKLAHASVLELPHDHAGRLYQFKMTFVIYSAKAAR
jgi:hypothetical protein